MCNHSECTKQVKSAAYTFLVRPTLEYASAAWDPSTIKDITKLEKVQRQAARFAHSNYHDRAPGCVTKMVSDLGWEPLQHQRRVERLSTLYKIQRGFVETDTDDIILPSDKRTRGQQRLYQPAANVSVYKNCFFPRTIQEWNTLPTSVTDAATLEEFCTSLGLDLLVLQTLINIYADCFYFNKLLIVFNLGRRWLSLSPVLVNCTFFSKNLDFSMEEEVNSTPVCAHLFQ